MNKIIVFGSFVVDLMSRAPHLPVPGETVKSSMFKMGPGGKGFNQGIASHKSGGNVTMVTKLGRDEFADVAMDMLKQQNMSTEFVFISDEVATGAALIMVDENTSQNAIMVASGACDTFNDEDIAKIEPIIKSSQILLTQLETNIDAVEKVIDIAYENGTKVILNPAPIQPIKNEIFRKIDIITPNEVEAEILTGIKIGNIDDARQAANYFLDKGVKEVVITLGKNGVLAVTKEKHELFGNYDVKVVDTTGAGDAFNGGFVTALAEGKDIFEACWFGNAVSNLAVTKLGTAIAMPTREDIDEFIKSNSPKRSDV
ncbi:MAG: ribokinase [Oscillospiraceae bacterium]